MAWGEGQVWGPVRMALKIPHSCWRGSRGWEGRGNWGVYSNMEMIVLGEARSGASLGEVDMAVGLQ